MTRWWISWARTPRNAMRPCSRATAAWFAIASSSWRSSSVNGVSRSTTSSPICLPRQRSGSRIAWRPARPSGQAMRPSSSTIAAPVARSGLDRGRHDRLERLLEVQAVRHRFRDPRERLELLHPATGLRKELGVLDRLTDLRRDRREQVDLGLGEGARLERTHVERALEQLAREDRHRENRLVLVFTEVRERLEPRVEMRLRRDHHRSSLGGGYSGDPLAATHARCDRLVRDPSAVRRAEHELVRALVVEVDEARIGLERCRNLVRDRLHHLLQVER